MKNPAEASPTGSTGNEQNAIIENGIEALRDTSDDAFLGGQLNLLQPRHGYRAGIDAVLLAACVPAAEADANDDDDYSLLDAGAGVGTVGLCAARRIQRLKVTLVEREPRLVELARMNIARNGLVGRATIERSDLTARSGSPMASRLAPDSFSVVVANPPYAASGEGTPSPHQLKRNSNALGPQESLDQWCRFLARMCRANGLMIMIHSADALDGVITGLNGRFGSLILQPLHPRENEEANRIIIAGRKGRRGRTRILPGISIHSQSHEFTPRIAAILRHGAPLELPL